MAAARTKRQLEQTVRAGAPLAVAWLTTLPSSRIVHVIEPGLCALITNAN